MKEVVQQMIVDFQAAELPDLIERDIAFPSFPVGVRKAQVYIGMRRSGKTYLMYQHMKTQLKKRVPKSHFCYVNFEDDRLIDFTISDFQLLLEAFFDLHPHTVKDKRVVFYFDEIQNVHGWEKFIRRLLDTTPIQVCITGSSAKMLSKEIATSLRGRCHTLEVFPLSFGEFVSRDGLRVKKRYSFEEQSLLRFKAKQFLQAGGFPEILEFDTTLGQQTLREYVNTAVYRDVVERHQLRNATTVRRFLTYCLQNLGAPTSIRKIYHTFKSMGINVSRHIFYDYLNYFSDAYLLFPVQQFSYSVRKQQVNAQKLYAIDQGLIHAFSIKPHMEESTCLESAVFIALRRYHERIFYYKTASDKEIDFVTESETGQLNLYQVCLDLIKPETRKREYRAIAEAAEELNLDTATIVTLNEEKKEVMPNGVTVSAIPYWRWALAQAG